MLPILNIGPVALQTPGLILLAGIWLGLWVADKRCDRSGIQPAQLDNLVFIALIAGLLGARMAYVARFPQAFLASPAGLISPNPQLLDPAGGFIVASLAALIYAQHRRMPIWNVLDALAPFLSVMAVATGLSHIASGSAFGAPSNLPWAIELWGAKRQPSQIYETLAALGIFFWVWKESARPAWPGHLFITFIALSSAVRLFLEAFRGDSVLVFHLRLAQLVAWILLAASLWLLDRRRAAGTQETTGAKGAIEVEKR
jgi:phosphatidylglycerol:prolipoprotein diacylglycerol transferase